MTLRTMLSLHAPLFKKDAPRPIDRVIDYFEGRAGDHSCHSLAGIPRRSRRVLKTNDEHEWANPVAG